MKSDIKVYMAPLEGITTWIYRNAHAQIYGKTDKYFTPFLSPAAERNFTEREMQEILPEHNKGLHVVPQLMISQADLCVRAVKELSGMGYPEVNLNFGCPSGIVLRKGKGAGMLKNPETLDRFLEDVFDGLSGVPADISVKTRIGIGDPQEFDRILPIYAKYPVSELTIHPRVREEFYKGEVHQKSFLQALEYYDNLSGAGRKRTKLVYNGNIFTVNDAQSLRKQFPETKVIMLGRGLLADPSLAVRIKDAYSCRNHTGNGPAEEETEKFFRFLKLAEEGYLGYFDEDIRVLERMKRLWTYMKDGPAVLGKEEALRQLFLCDTLKKYDEILESMLY